MSHSQPVFSSIVSRQVDQKILRLLHHHQRIISLDQLLSAFSSSRGQREYFHCTNAISPISNHRHQKGTTELSTHPSLVPGVDASLGVALPFFREIPRRESCASRSFASLASARRFLKSERATRPTVWSARSSSADLAWDVKRWLLNTGVPVLDGGSEGGFDDILTCNEANFARNRKYVYRERMSLLSRMRLKSGI